MTDATELDEAEVTFAGRLMERGIAEMETEVTSSDIQPCPECRAGKHPNCDGSAWDSKKDEPAACPCAIGGHAS